MVVHAILGKLWNADRVNWRVDLSTEDLEALKLELGADLGELFYHVKQDVFRLRPDWRTYRMFFGTNKERVDMFNGISAPVAEVLARTLFEATLLGLRRITDKPAKTNSQNNISIKALTKHFSGSDLETMRRLVNQAENAASFARNWSDKKIAHSDFQHRTGAIALEPASRAKVDQAIDAVAAVVKWISSEKLNAHQVTHPIPAAHDELWVLKHLYEGELVMRQKKIQSREYSMQSRYDERKALYEYPDWMQSEDPGLDTD